MSAYQKKTTRTRKETEVKAEIDAERKEEKRELTNEEVTEALQTPQAQEFIKKLIADALAAQQPVIQKVVAKDEDTITLCYMSAVAEGAGLDMGNVLGTIEGNGGIRIVPKTLFFQNQTKQIRSRLKDRLLLVIDGLTDAERQRYGLVYDNEELVPEEVFRELLNWNEEKVLHIFDKACPKHKQIIAMLYIDAYNKGDNRVNQGIITKLNNLSKKVEPNGMFSAIIKDMAAQLSASVE